MNVHSQTDECNVLGWFPEDFGLKDHSVFTYDGYYYIVSINVPVEEYFAYARSQDLCHWEDLSPVLSRQTGIWDTLAIWAPQVLEDNGVYFMYYTGVKGPYPNMTQSIMLATTTTPSDPTSWVVEGMVFQPDHPGMIWTDGTWADCRDPHVVKVENLYYMFYTGRDIEGGIVGLATTESPYGPWQDFGSILILDTGMAESPTIWQANGGYYIFYNRTSNIGSSGEKYRFGPTLGGPWSEENALFPGWAHEVWLGMDSQLYTSYLTNYTVTIKPMTWNTRFEPPKPFIGSQILETYLPMINR